MVHLYALLFGGETKILLRSRWRVEEGKAERFGSRIFKGVLKARGFLSSDLIKIPEKHK